MKVLLGILQLRLLFMLTSVVLVFYLLSNFICDLDEHLFLFFVIIRSLFLKRPYLIVLQHLLAPLIYLCLCDYELGQFLSLLPRLLRLEVVELVIPRETVNQTVPALTAPLYHLLLLELPLMRPGILDSLDVRLYDPLHLPLPRPEALLHIVFLEQVHKRLVHLVLTELLGQLSLLEVLGDQLFVLFKLFVLFQEGLSLSVS
jgi:hypothetical protein